MNQSWVGYQQWNHTKKEEGDVVAVLGVQEILYWWNLTDAKILLW
jgi:hypothetical protein